MVVFETPDGERHLQNSGKVEGSTQELDRQTTSLLSLLPIAAAEEPKSVLVVGLGTGFTTEAALDAGMERVDTVEINDSVVTASEYFVEDRVESNPASEIFVTDARNYLETTDRTYDVITSEPSYPLSTHVSHLFTQEFYELAKSRLNDDGVYCQWIPRYLLTDEDTLMMMKTFAEVFPNSYIWGSNQGGDEAVDMLLIGVNGDRALDPSEIDEAVRLSAPIALDFGYFGGPDDVAEAVADPSIPVNTDDLPYLEFRAPRNQISSTSRVRGAGTVVASGGVDGAPESSRRRRTVPWKHASARARTLRETLHDELPALGGVEVGGIVAEPVRTIAVTVDAHAVEVLRRDGCCGRELGSRLDPLVVSDRRVGRILAGHALVPGPRVVAQIERETGVASRPRRQAFRRSPRRRARP